jgi:hypothetical protein
MTAATTLIAMAAGTDQKRTTFHASTISATQIPISQKYSCLRGFGGSPSGSSGTAQAGCAETPCPVCRSSSAVNGIARSSSAWPSALTPRSASTMPPPIISTAPMK